MKKLILGNEWELKLQRVNVGKQDMNKLVMNFLVAEGFVKAAEQFQLESGTDHKDLAIVLDRVEFERAVRMKDTDHAIGIVSHMDPEILNKNPKVLFKLHQLRFTELVRDDRIEEAMVYAREKFGPMAFENGFQEEFESAFALLLLYSAPNNPATEWLLNGYVNETIRISRNIEKESKLKSFLKMLEWVDRELDKGVLYPKIRDFSTCIPGDPEPPPRNKRRRFA